MLLYLFADDFDQHALSSATVEPAIEDLLPRAKIQFAVRDGNDYFTTHDLSLEIRVCVVFAGKVMEILVDRLVRG